MSFSYLKRNPEKFAQSIEIQGPRVYDYLQNSVIELAKFRGIINNIIEKTGNFIIDED